VPKEKALNALILALWSAGALHLLIASANFFAARKFRYRENLAQVTPIVRQVFVVQNVYIVLLLCGLSCLCFGFAHDLAGGSPLGRTLSGFLALFWGLRLLLQLCYYDAELKRQHHGFNLAFLLAESYLTVVFVIATLSTGG
jgi:alginate O-acetyltransferase complex protein AlgI